MEDELQQVAEEFATVYSYLSDEEKSPEELEVGRVDSLEDEASVLLPELDINLQDWREWSPVRKLEVYIHEYAHTENYGDDHQLTFWDRVGEHTLEVAEGIDALNDVFEGEYNGAQLIDRVIESVHEGVVEPERNPEEIKRYLKEEYFIREKPEL